MVVHSAPGPAGEPQLRTRVARVLETGFRVAVGIMAAGLVLSIIKQEPLPDTMGQPRELVAGLANADPGSLIGLGIMAIILTPFVSTLVIAWTFHEQGNRRYALISGLVLLILLASIGLSKV